MIGQTLGHYRIVEKIGAGGMGEVYRAHDEKLERDVALKVLPAGMLADEAARKRFRREALALAKLNHPNIETIYEFASQDGVDFLAMELVAGVTLGQKLTGGPLSDKEVLQLGAQIVEGLNAAHEKGIVHCDLKPANVMVSSSGRAKVLDFGLAKFLHTANDSSITESAADMAAAGTLPYMSPEQLRGERVDARSDIYGAGTLLYEMSTGQRPFPETNPPRLIEAILHKEPNPPSAINRKVPSGFDSLVLKSLDKQPERRYQSAKELAVDLGRLSSPALPIVPARPRKKRGVWLAVGAAVAVIALCISAIPRVRHLFIHHKTDIVTHPLIPNFAEGKNLAVFPFEVEGDQTELGYIGDGLAESLRIRLSELSGLHVRSGLAVRSVVGQPLAKVKQRLGVNLVLRGVVRKTTQGLQVAMNLQNVSDAQPFWTHEFPTKLSALLPIQDQMYEQVLSALAVKETDKERFRGFKRPTVSESAYNFYLKGQEMAAQEPDPDLDGAIHFYEEALKQQRDFDLPYIGLASANLRLYGKNHNKVYLQRAANAARQAGQANDDSAFAHYALASVYRASSKYKEAVDELKKAALITPCSDETYWRLGNVYMSAGQPALAVEANQKAVQLDPSYWVNENSLGNAYFQMGEYDKALQAFKQVTLLAPDVEAGHENVGNVLVQQGKYAEAVPYLERAVQLESSSGAYSNLGTAYFFLKQYPKAVEMFEKAVTLDRTDTEMMVNMGDSYRFIGKQDMARAAYLQAIYLGNKQLETNPKDAAVMMEMALAYSLIGDARQGDIFIRRARAIDMKDVNAIYCQAQVHALENRPNEALEVLQQAFEKQFPAEFASVDPDLENLHRDPRFNALIEKYSKKPD